MAIHGSPRSRKDGAIFGAGVSRSEARYGGKFEEVGEGSHVAHGTSGGGDFFVLLSTDEVFGAGDGFRGLVFRLCPRARAWRLRDVRMLPVGVQ